MQSAKRALSTFTVEVVEYNPSLIHQFHWNNHTEEKPYYTPTPEELLAADTYQRNGRNE